MRPILLSNRGSLRIPALRYPHRHWLSLVGHPRPAVGAWDFYACAPKNHPQGLQSLPSVASRGYKRIQSNLARLGGSEVAFLFYFGHCRPMGFWTAYFHNFNAASHHQPNCRFIGRQGTRKLVLEYGPSGREWSDVEGPEHRAGRPNRLPSHAPCYDSSSVLCSRVNRMTGHIF